MTLTEICQKAFDAKYEVQNLSTEIKNKALLAVADEIIAESEGIIAANGIDLENAKKNGMHPGMIDRLTLNDGRIEAIAEGLRQVAGLPDPIGEVMEEFTRPNGMKIKKVRVPMGVVGIIYESRPNVTPDAFALTFKSGNAVILKGGSDCIHSNIAITKAIKKALEANGVTPEAIQLIEDTDREVTKQFMTMKQYVDVLIPRGSAGLIRSVVEEALIPVIETGSGNCHIFVDESADIDMALYIIYNAKTQRIGVCNSMESLVVHRNIMDRLLPAMKERLASKNVKYRADKDSISLIPGAEAAEDVDFATEYLDYMMSVKTVDNIDEAISHINKYSTNHSESIITSNKENADKFLREIDSACVYVNASTRFSDGNVFGLGAEIGISTQRLHARGPMGLKELTTYKYNIEGTGQVRD
jgi:glutamate-5-semialdehyde dehydrogenase